MRATYIPTYHLTTWQVWLHESMTVITAVDPVDFGGLLGTWGEYMAAKTDG